MSSDNELMIKISADVAEMKKGMDEALKALDSVAKGAASTATMTGLATVAFQEMANILKQAASAVYSYVSAQWDAIDALGDTSIALGIATADLQQFQYAATLSGSSAEGATMLLRGMQMSLAQAGKDGEESAQKFNKLGLSVKDLKALAPAEAAAKLADAVAQVKGSAEQTGAAMEVFGRGARENLAFIKQGGENMRSLSEEAKGLGIGLKEVDVKNVKDAQDGIDGLKIRMSAVGMTVAKEVAPAITGIVTELGKSLRAAEQNKNMFEGLADTVATIADQVNNFMNGLAIAWNTLIALMKSAVLIIVGVVDTALTIVNQIIAGYHKILMLANELAGDEEAARAHMEAASEAVKNNYAWTVQSANDLEDTTQKIAASAEAWANDGHRFRNALAEARKDAEALSKLPPPPVVAPTGGVVQLTENYQQGTAMGPDSGGPSPEFLKQQADLQALRDLHAQYREQKLKDDLTQSQYEAQAEDLKYADAKQRFLNAYADKDANDLSRKEAERQLEQDHQDALTRIHNMAVQERLSAASQFFGNMASLMQSGNKKLFEIGKVAAIAQATVDMWQSAASSFAFGARIGGPVLGGAMAAAALVSGAVRIANIAKTTMGGGGGGGGSAGGGGYTGGEGGNSAAAAPAPRQTNVNISLQGSSFSDVQVRGLIASIGEAMGDNVKLGVA